MGSYGSSVGRIHEFLKLTGKLLSVPRAEIQKRIDAHREQAAQNAHKRGPKRTAVGTISSARFGNL
jgi:hypothetical protein